MLKNRIIRFISILTCAAVVSFSFVACAQSGAPEYDVSAPKFAVSTEKLETELAAFLDECADRTTFQNGEKQAAEYLRARLTEFGHEPELQSFTVEENGVAGLTSQNVVARYLAADRDDDTPNVILGAYYDNRYSQSYTDAKAFRSEAALAGGTSVATLLSIAEYLTAQRHELSFDVTLVFFGASYIYSDGAQAFWDSGMTAEERKNTVLMAEMQRLGVDHVYAYTDERPTAREKFFDDVARANGLDVYKLTQKTPYITGATAYEGLPFYRWAHNGVFGTFVDEGIPTLNLVGANWETMDLTDAESADNKNIAYTENDDLETLKEYHPDHALKMATAATLVIRALESPEFIEVMQSDRDNFPHTGLLTEMWVWYLIALGVTLVVAATLILVYGRLVKKYPIVAPQPRRMKMAVFGMDYEDRDSADIFIDIKSSVGEDIFPGVPNNDNALDGIFPPITPTDSGGDNNKTPSDESDARSDNDDDIFDGKQ